MPEPVYVIGAGRTDFKRNFKKEGKTLRDIIFESANLAIKNAEISPADIQSGVVGNFAAGLFTRQLHLGSLLTEAHPSLKGIPTIHVEAACASGALAVLTAAQQIMGGIYDVVLVVGAEQQKTMSPSDGGDVLGAAGDFALERPQYGEFMFPKLFAKVAQIYQQRYGLTDQQLASVACKNYAHAKMNPLSQTRDVNMTMEYACTESKDNPRFAPPLKISDCSQVTDGGAAVVLCSERFARKNFGNKIQGIRLLGFGHSTDSLSLEKKDVPTFSVARKAVAQAFQQSGLRLKDIQGAEIHDCFSISEIVAYEILGLARDGEGAGLTQTGATMHRSIRNSHNKPPFDLPVNVSGGLIADGHPVGATGVRQVVEAFLHLTGTAGQRQIEGAQKFLTFNMGGSLTTSVVMIWAKD